MLKKIYRELVEIKEELQATRMNKRTLTIDNLNAVRMSTAGRSWNGADLNY